MKRMLTILYLVLIITATNTVAKQSEVVVVTGTAQGVGFACVEYLAKQGYNVCAGIRKSSDCKNINAVAQQYPNQVMVVELDVTDEHSIALGIEKVIQRFGRIDVLVNNACIVYMGIVETKTIAEQKHEFEVNYFGPVRMIQAVAPIMRKQNSGKIINISSVAGIQPFPVIENYSVTKGALESLSESLVLTLAPWNIHISILQPGAIRTKVTEHMFKGTRINKETQCFADYEQQVATFFAARKEIKPNTPGVSEPIDLAHAVEKIILAEKPDFRYQIGDEAKELAKKRYIDPTGNIQIRSGLIPSK